MDFSNIGKGVYWKGQDGNFYMKAQGLDGVQRWRAPLAAPDKLGLKRIDDPMAPNDNRESAPSGGGSGGSGGGSDANQKVLNRAAVGATKKAISSLDRELQTGYKNIDDSYGSLIGRYDRERDNTEEDYTEGTVTNNQNFQRNKQNSLVAAAQGLRGLRSVLGSIGAIGGDGAKLANQAVTTSANQDIGGATESAATNAQALDKAWERFGEEDEDRRREADVAKKNQRTALEGSVAGKRQDYYQKMAELYGEIDDVGNATQWLNRAGNLNDDIASKTRVLATPFSPRAAAFTPGDLDSYLAGAGDMTVEVTGDSVAARPSMLNANNRETEEQRRRRLMASA